MTDTITNIFPKRTYMRQDEIVRSVAVIFVLSCLNRQNLKLHIVVLNFDLAKGVEIFSPCSPIGCGLELDSNNLRLLQCLLTEVTWKINGKNSTLVQKVLLQNGLDKKT